MRLFTRSRVLPPALFAITALFVVSTENTVSATAQKEKKDKEKEKKDKEKKDKDARDFKDGSGKAAKDLRKAYDAIVDLSQTPPVGREAARIYEQTVRLYREAVRAFGDDPRRAAALGAAANDGARGLEDLRHASLKPVPGLPEPPVETGQPLPGPKGKGPPAWNAGADAEPGPWSEALEALSRARDRLAGPDADGGPRAPVERDFAPPPKGPAGPLDGGIPATGPARDVFDAAKAVYGRARAAYDAGDYRRATYLARAAEAWSHIPEHLIAAGGELGTPMPLAPQPKQKGPPPPPPAIKE